MNFNSIVKASRMVGHFVTTNSPTILTISAMCGVVGTGVLAGKGAIRASKKLEELEYTSETKPTMVQKVGAVSRDLAPAVLMGVATMACIFGAHKIHLQRNAAIVAAYTVLDNKFKDYQAEVVKELGSKKEDRIKDKAAQERVNREVTPDQIANAYRTRFGDVLFMDSYTGRLFYSSYDAVEGGRLKVTDIAQRDMSASLNDLYRAWEIPEVDALEDVGWNIADIQDKTGDAVIEVTTNRVCKTPGPEALPCVMVDYDVMPVINFNRWIA